MNKNIFINSTGVSLVAVIIITGIVVVGGYFVYTKLMAPEVMEEKMTENGEMMEEEETMVEGDDTMMEEKDKMMEETESEKMSDGAMMKIDFSGSILAGSSSPLLDYNKADFDKAVSSGKLVVLFFYANWCPICRVEFPKMEDAFGQLSGDEVVGFRVNFNDDQTDSDEENLAREHGVAYQHTKVFIKDGKRVLKSPESWSSASVYLEKIGQYK